MPDFNFWLSNEYTDRLFALKEEEGRDDLTGNEYARELLEKYLRTLHPEIVRYDEETGDIIRRKKP